MPRAYPVTTKLMDACSRLLGRKTLSRNLHEFLFEYETPKVVNLRSYRVGTIYRIGQIGILAYIIGYVFILEKGYQDTDSADYSVATKLKGILHHNMSGVKEVWDAVDFAVPPQENGAFFIATNLIYTANQSQRECAEDANVGKKGVHCLTDDDCPPDEATPYGNGIRTGRCLPWDNNRTRTCEIISWCPTEVDVTPDPPVLRGFDTVTVLVKHYVTFLKYGKKRRNIVESINASYLGQCSFHPETDPLCPIFGIKDIVKFANESFDEMAVRGGIISFNINWDCDFDYDEKDCVPEYSFRRLDGREDKIGRGWNFRHAYYSYDPTNGHLRRDLIKLSGIRFVFIVKGVARKFSPVNFAMNLGSGLGLLACASILCEAVLMTCMTKKNDRLQNEKKTKLERSIGAKPANVNGRLGSGDLHSVDDLDEVHEKTGKSDDELEEEDDDEKEHDESERRSLNSMEKSPKGKGNVWEIRV